MLRKQSFALLLALVLCLSLSAAAYAADSTGTLAHVTDMAGILSADQVRTLDSSAVLGRAVKGATLWYYKKGHDLRYEEIWENGEIATSRSFYPDSLGGKLASEAFWKEGKRNGILRNWYKSGVLRDSLTFVNGERVGEQFSYDSTGKLKREPIPAAPLPQTFSAGP